MPTIVYKHSKMSNKSDKSTKQANKNTKVSNSKNNVAKCNVPRRVVSSKMLPPHTGSKSCPTGILDIDRTSKAASKVVGPKKTTKSDSIIKKTNKDLDFCKKCGDTISKTSNLKSNSKSTSSSGKLSETSRNKSVIVNETPTFVDQYYKNENFQRSTESIEDVDIGFKKVSLDTIKELSEKRSSEICKGTNQKSETLDEFREEIGFLDTDDFGSVKKLKEFRDNNYFECHSAKSRIENKVNAISLKDHKCTYRFYLNDRLFPVPVSTDHHDNIRCVECHLPLDLRNSDDAMTANGFIQAKIRIGEGHAQDTVMYLPVKDQLIIRERKKDEKKEEEAFYFGVIKLDKNGNSIFHQNLPTNSFALKYQKGYKEYHHNERYRLQSVDNNVIVI